MTDTFIGSGDGSSIGAVCWPQDDGTGVSDGSEDYDSAAYFGTLSRVYSGEEYVADGLTFQNISTTDGSESFDLNRGTAFVVESSNKVQSGADSAYDITIPTSMTYVVIVPNDVTGLGLDKDATNDIWLASDPTTNDSIYIRHGTSLGAPSDPHVKLGTIDSSNGNTTRPNDRYSDEVIAEGTITLSSGKGTVSTGVSDGKVDIYLDPSGDGANSSDVRASARSFWDNSASEIKVEILEDGTAVGNPTIGYTVVRH